MLEKRDRRTRRARTAADARVKENARFERYLCPRQGRRLSRKMGRRCSPPSCWDTMEFPFNTTPYSISTGPAFKFLADTKKRFWMRDSLSPNTKNLYKPNGRLVWAGEHKRRCCNAEPTNLLGPLVCLLSRKEEILNSAHSTPQLCLAFVLNGFILRSLAHGRSLHQSPRCLFCFPSVWLWFSRLPSGKAR